MWFSYNLHIIFRTSPKIVEDSRGCSDKFRGSRNVAAWIAKSWHHLAKITHILRRLLRRSMVRSCCVGVFPVQMYRAHLIFGRYHLTNKLKAYKVYRRMRKTKKWNNWLRGIPLEAKVRRNIQIQIPKYKSRNAHCRKFSEIEHAYNHEFPQFIMTIIVIGKYIPPKLFGWICI